MDEKTTPKKTRRVGTLAFALVLILAGVLLMLYQIVPAFNLLQIVKFSPVILIVMAHHLTLFPPYNLKNFAGALALGGVSALLVLVQPDLGSALVYGVMIFVALLVAGAPKRYLLSLVGGAAALLPLAVSEWGPARSSAISRIETEKVDALYSALTADPELKAKTGYCGVNVWFNHDAGGSYTLQSGDDCALNTTLTGPYADMVKEHFMKCVPPTDHKFAALHGAVWSGGSFVYVPKGVQVSIPLQSYFRLNAKGAGQFEHTLIIVDEGASLHFIEGCSAPKYNVANLHAGCVELYVKKGAKLRYSTIENWSKNMYNLNTKRALVEEDGTIEWISGSFGSHVGCLYPMSILKGDRARMEFTGVTFAGAGQNLDTGAKVVHVGKNTSSYMNTRSISKSGGISTFRSSVVVEKSAKQAKSAVSCQSLMLDSESRSDTIPAMDIRTRDAAIGHEAKIGSISNDAVFYLMSRGMSEEDARALIVSGFADNVSKELPVEYAVEMNNLIRLEMKGSIG